MTICFESVQKPVQRVCLNLLYLSLITETEVGLLFWMIWCGSIQSLRSVFPNSFFLWTPTQINQMPSTAPKLCHYVNKYLSLLPMLFRRWYRLHWKALYFSISLLFVNRSALVCLKDDSCWSTICGKRENHLPQRRACILCAICWRKK